MKGNLKIQFAAAVNSVVYPLKQLIKNTVPLLGSLFLFFAGAKANRDGYKKRVLIMFGGGIGDVAKRSIVCAYAKQYLPDHEIYHLMPYDITLPYAKQTIYFDYKKSKIDPRYYFDLVNKLRRIGFSDIIVLLPAWEGFLASLGKNILPDRVFRYVEVPPKELLGSISSFTRLFNPRSRVFCDIPIVSFYDERWKRNYYPSDVSRVAYFFSQAAKKIDGNLALDEHGMLSLQDPRTEVVVDPVIEKEYLKKIEDQYHIDLKKCCLIGLGSSTVAKNWPAERFVEAAKYVAGRGMKVVIMDHIKDVRFVNEFAVGYGNDFLNLGGTATLQEVCVLIKHGGLVLSNDTSYVHIAVALRTPSVCVCRNTQIGADSCYGYPDINTWVFADSIEKVEVSSVNKALDRTISHIEKAASVPQEKFVESFFEQ